MLQLTIPQREWFNDATQEFIIYPQRVLQLEHSLISISKWESKWKKPFLGRDDKRTYEESLDYVRCMTINTQSDPNVYKGLTRDIFEKIKAYMEDCMTATTFSNRAITNGGGRARRETITSELIYYWMVNYGIPFECEKWHINRLLTLIRICEIKNRGDKRMKRGDIYARNKALNNANRAKFNSKG